MRHVSTPESRMEARDRASRLSSLERVASRVEASALKVGMDAQAGVIRLARTRIALAVAVTAGMVLGSVHDFRLPF